MACVILGEMFRVSSCEIWDKIIFLVKMAMEDYLFY